MAVNRSPELLVNLTTSHVRSRPEWLGKVITDLSKTLARLIEKYQTF